MEEDEQTETAYPLTNVKYEFITETRNSKKILMRVKSTLFSSSIFHQHSLAVQYIGLSLYGAVNMRFWISQYDSLENSDISYLVQTHNLSWSYDEFLRGLYSGQESDLERV